VSVIDGATNTVTATIPVGNSPFGLAVNPATNTIYVGNGLDDTVSVIDGANNTVTATIPLAVPGIPPGGSSPFGLAVNPATNTVYVASIGTNSGPDNIAVIDGATNTVTANITVVGFAGEVAVDPTTNTVYVASSDPGTVAVIDGATNTVKATIAVNSGNPFENLFGIAVDPATHLVYVADQDGGTVAVIDGATNTVTATIPLGTTTRPSFVAVDSAAHTIYVSASGVSVIDGATNTVTATVAPGGSPQGIAVDPVTHTAYVASINGGNTVSVITSTPATDTDLSLSPPANISANASGPLGATVNYPLPTVTDEDTTVTPTCTPSSGSLFPVETTTVNCSVSDNDDANSPATTSFTVTVKGAAAQLADLKSAVQLVGPGGSLVNKLIQVETFLASGDIADACGTLGALENQVQAQSGKSIPQNTATQVIIDAQRIHAVLAC
jgi:YVTN family beta-propeller protein